MIETVGDLIEALSKYPKDKKVYSNHITETYTGKLVVDHENTPEEEEIERKSEEIYRKEHKEMMDNRGAITSFADRW